MKNAAFSIEELFRFLDAGVSAFHSTAAASAILEAEGYVNCPESAAWELAPGGKYYTTRNGSAVLAWRMPKGELTGWHAAATATRPPGASSSSTRRTRSSPRPRSRATAA
jgi:aspartyl aminopeptidase